MRVKIRQVAGKNAGFVLLAVGEIGQGAQLAQVGVFDGRLLQAVEAERRCQDVLELVGNPPIASPGIGLQIEVVFLQILSLVIGKQRFGMLQTQLRREFEDVARQVAPLLFHAQERVQSAAIVPAELDRVVQREVVARRVESGVRPGILVAAALMLELERQGMILRRLPRRFVAKRVLALFLVVLQIVRAAGDVVEQVVECQPHGQLGIVVEQTRPVLFARSIEAREEGPRNSIIEL